MKRGFVAAIGFSLSCALAAGCGSNGSSKADTTTPTTASAVTQQWISAAREGLLSDNDKPPNMTPTDATCLARAFVGTITVAKLKDAGVTLADMRDSNADLPAHLSKSLARATKLTLGAAMQSCGVGRLIGPLIAQGIAEESAKGYKLSSLRSECVANGFDDRANRLVVAEMFLSPSSSNPSARSSTAIAKILSKCLDWAAIFSATTKAPFSASEAACINRFVPNAPAFTSALASEISGKSNANSDGLFAAPLLACLSQERLARLGGAATA